MDGFLYEFRGTIFPMAEIKTEFLMIISSWHRIQSAFKRFGIQLADSFCIPNR